MGPLVPELIAGNLNLIIALFIGMAFGFILEQAGFSSTRKLVGLFYGYDFTVLRVFFTAGITALTGLLLLGQLGLLDWDIIYINPTFLASAILGGLIMGLGFILGGYCPGTSFCGAAIGKIDAMVFVLGSFLGIFLFAEAFPFLKNIYIAGDLGDLQMHKILSVKGGVFALSLTTIALAAFYVTTLLEKKINPMGPARDFPVRIHRLAAGAILLLALILALLPERTERLLARATNYNDRYRIISTDELAFRILDRDPKIRVIDLRTPEAFRQETLPGAINIPLYEMFGRQWENAFSARNILKIFVGDNAVHSRQGAALAALLGYENLAAYEAGAGEFYQILSSPPQMPNPDAAAFRQSAVPQLRILAQQLKDTPPPPKIKKITGGCGS